MTKFRANPWAVLLVVSLGFFMTLLDLTIVNIAIPDMITRLHASLDDILWVINAYALVLAVLVITAGRLGDLIGPRIMFALGIGVFTAASAACGLAPSAGWLIGFRAVQGLGAAMLMPQTLTIITNTFPADRRGAAFGVWGAVAGRGHDRRADPRRPAGDRVRLALDLLRQPAVRRGLPGADLPHHPGPAARPAAPDRRARRAAGQRGPAGHLLRPGRGAEVQLGDDHRVHQHPAGVRGRRCCCWPVSCCCSGGPRTGSRWCRSRCSATGTTRW